MTLLARLPILRSLSAHRKAAAAMAGRWRRAAAVQPGIVTDLIRIGGVLALQPDTYEGGVPMGAPLDPVRLAYEAGRRDMAVQLIALAGIGPFELNQLMESDDEID